MKPQSHSSGIRALNKSRRRMVAKSSGCRPRLPGTLGVEFQLRYFPAVCVTLGKLLNYSVLGFSTYEMLIIIVPVLEGWF